MNTQEIIDQTTTKTRKIEQLILLGLTRKDIATLVTNGNYGFVQNVYAKMKAEGRLTPTAIANFIPQPFNRRFGIEIEAYNVNAITLSNALNAAGISTIVEGYNHTTRANWKIVRDSSIIGEQSLELVSPVLTGTGGMQQIETVCRVLKTLNAYVNKSCGLHVHFDAQNISLNQWKNVYLNYAGFEKQIDQVMPVSRRDSVNQYCQSLNSINNLVTKIKTATSLDAIKRVFDGDRYFKINPTSYARHNTIEFRQHSGTIEFEKISNWVLFLHNLVDYSQNNLAADHSWNTLTSINQAEIITFYHNRKQELA